MAGSKSKAWQYMSHLEKQDWQLHTWNAPLSRPQWADCVWLPETVQVHEAETSQCQAPAGGCCLSVQIYTNIRRFKEDLTKFPPQYFVCVPLVIDTLHTKVHPPNFLSALKPDS